MDSSDQEQTGCQGVAFCVEAQLLISTAHSALSCRRNWSRRLGPCEGTGADAVCTCCPACRGRLSRRLVILWTRHVRQVGGCVGHTGMGRQHGRHESRSRPYRGQG
jgi:hypothetical protein